MRSFLVLVALAVSCGSPPSSLSPEVDGSPSPPLPPNPPPPGDALSSAPESLACASLATAASPLEIDNVILLLGDGMGVGQLLAARALEGGTLRAEGLRGPVFINTDSLTSFDTGSPTDSAASATAMATGELTYNGAIAFRDGMDLYGLGEWTRARSASVGLVTTTNVYDASPMAFVAHAASRGNTAEILAEVFADARPEVLMGGAGSHLDEESERADAVGAGYDVVRNRQELEAWSPAESRILGVFESSAGDQWPTTPVHLRTAASSDPPLSVMVERALARLERDPDGFFLLVENEHIDELGHRAGSHLSESTLAVPVETAELDRALGVVLDWVAERSSFEKTLVVFTADHECGGVVYDANTGALTFDSPGSHTRAPVAVYARGPGADVIERLCSVADLHLLLTGRL